MKEIIIYGAGNEGANAFWVLRSLSEYKILFFADRDEKKIGTYYFGKKVLHPETIKQYPEASVFIACREFYADIYKYLTEMGINHIEGGFGSPSWCIKSDVITTWDELNHYRCIDLGKFLLKAAGENGLLNLPNLPYRLCESGVLDYAFLYALGVLYQAEYYLEIGTYIGTSIHIMSHICEECFSITAPPNGKDSMKKYCQKYHMTDYSDRLAICSNIKHFYTDSKTFDFNQINKDINIYFIDADHDYNQVYIDTKNVFASRNPNSFVVWHDFAQDKPQFDGLVLAVKDCLGDEFANVFITDNNNCGIYVPREYQEELPLTTKEYKDGKDEELYVYDTRLSIKVYE